LFEHPYFDVYSFDAIPLDRDCYLMDEIYVNEYEAALLSVFAGNDYESVGYVSFAAIRKINEHSLDLSWYPDTFHRFHEVLISLPKDQVVCCVGSWHYSEKPRLFVKSGWLEQLHLRTYTVFCLIDAIGVKEALTKGVVSRGKLVSLRTSIDQLARKYPEACFISFADSLLIKSNWTVGHIHSSIQYTYEPEVFVRIVSDLQTAYKEALGLDIYAIFAQGTNEYYDDALVHVSDTGNHVSLNSLGIPFAELMAIEASVRKAIREKGHPPSELYLDDRFFNSLKFRFEFSKQDVLKHPYVAPMTGTSAYYRCIQLRDVLENLRSDPILESK
jgi:hypothetical protein